MRPTLRFFFLIAFAGFSICSQAQVQFSGWLASFNTFRLGKRTSLLFEAQLRSTDKFEQVGTILLRPGLNYHLNKTLTLAAGYALVLGRRTANGVSGLLDEHRIWQQALVSHKIGTANLSHRFRFEERFLPRASVTNNRLTSDGHDQAFRFRYFVRSQIPLQNREKFTKGLYLALQDEIFLNTGTKTAVNGKTFDQNRLFGAIGWRFPGKMDVEMGYLNQYTSTRTRFVNNHVVQMSVYKRL